MTQKIKTLKILHLAICMGILVTYFTTAKISMNTLQKVPAVDSGSLFYIGISVAAIVLGTFLFKMQLKKADKKLKIEDNFPIYLTASLIRWAIIEMVAFMILFSKPDCIVLGLLLIAYLVYLRPTEEKIKEDFQY